MSISQPPLNEDPTTGAWNYEVASEVNRLELRILELDSTVTSLLEAIASASDLTDLKTRIESL